MTIGMDIATATPDECTARAIDIAVEASLAAERVSEREIRTGVAVTMLQERIAFLERHRDACHRESARLKGELDAARTHVTIAQRQRDEYKQLYDEAMTKLANANQDATDIMWRNYKPYMESTVAAHRLLDDAGVGHKSLSLPERVRMMIDQRDHARKLLDWLSARHIAAKNQLRTLVDEL